MWPSGTIVEVAPDGSSLVVEEMVAWRGPGTGVVTCSIWNTPQTSIRLVERTDRWNRPQTSMPGWDSRVIDARIFHPEDFVTVTTGEDAHGVAVTLPVVRPEA